VFKHPSADGVTHRDDFRQSSLQARSERAKLRTEIPDTDFDETVAPRVIALRMLFTDLVHVVVVGLDPEFLEGLLHELLEGCLVVGFDDEPCVAKPSDVLRDQLNRQLAIIHAFVRHHMSEDVLAVAASHDDAFHHFAFLARFQQGSLALHTLREVDEFAPRFQTLAGHVEVVDAHYGDF